MIFMRKISVAFGNGKVTVFSSFKINGCEVEVSEIWSDCPRGTICREFIRCKYGGREGSSGIIERMNPIYWTMHKKNRVKYFEFGAEILTAADADDRGYDLKLSFNSILGYGRIKQEIYADSRPIFDMVTTLHEPREFRHRKTVARMRETFGFGELEAMK